MLALFPFFEWIIHVFVLHWRPKRFGAVDDRRVCSRASTAPTTWIRAVSR